MKSLTFIQPDEIIAPLQTQTGSTVTVLATRISGYQPSDTGYGGTYSYDTSGNDQYPDDAQEISVVLNIYRALTPQEELAVNKFVSSLKKAATWLNNLPSNSLINLDDKTVTAKGLLDIWYKNDFINEKGTDYLNKSMRGEANWNNGDPVTSINIDILEGYINVKGGDTYLSLHEIAHMTFSQRDHLSQLSNDSDGYTPADAIIHERSANDIAKAIALFNNGDVLDTPGNGYSPTVFVFVEPSLIP